jgi:hypothetical protein
MRRVRVTGVVLACLAAAAAPARAADLPDLEQLPPYKVRVAHRDGGWYLGFAAAVRNAGPGALRIRGYGPGSGGMVGRQLSGDGAQVLAGDVGRLRYVTTYGHDHWHFMDFMRYELRGLDEPGVLLDRKQGFCLGDAPFVDGWCAKGKPSLTTTDLGIRPGGIDIYEPWVEGQEIRIDPATAPSGRYVLSSRIGPTGVLREGRTDNNAASAVIELRWPLRDGQEIAPLRTCVGAGCAGGLPAPRARRMRAADARRLARRALRRETGRPGRRVRCRPSRRGGHLCRARLPRRSASVRVWYIREGAATRWYYTLKTGRLRRADRLGGTLGARASAAALVCRLP